MLYSSLLEPTCDLSQQVRTIEEGQSLIRQLQEMWLFGQLNTIGDTKAKQRSDDTAKALSGLLQQLAATQRTEPAEDGMATA